MNQDPKFNIADMKQAPQRGQKTETIRPVGASIMELSQIDFCHFVDVAWRRQYS